MQRMPVLFIGHGSPMNAIEDNEFTREWSKITEKIGKPKLIICISAHWMTEGTGITAMPKPRIIHDFYGFPKQLYAKQYPADGSPVDAKKIAGMIKTRPVSLDQSWGLDHGTWSVLIKMFPKADIPVIQLSINSYMTEKEHYAMGKELTMLRDSGVLIIGSGNIVHNLMRMNPDAEPYDWAVNFDAFVKKSIENKDYNSIIEYTKQKSAMLAHPSNEHYIPLLYTAGASDDSRPIFFNEKIVYGSISMRCIIFG